MHLQEEHVLTQMIIRSEMYASAAGGGTRPRLTAFACLAPPWLAACAELGADSGKGYSGGEGGRRRRREG
eukprot:5208506-Pyramimonas_sp.AAC.1